MCIVHIHITQTVTDRASHVMMITRDACRTRKEGLLGVACRSCSTAQLCRRVNGRGKGGMVEERGGW